MRNVYESLINAQTQKSSKHMPGTLWINHQEKYSRISATQFVVQERVW